MGDINGMKLARQMRAIHKDFVLIFVTNYGEYAAEGYEVNAFRFLPKLQLAEKLPSYFRQALAACRSRTRTLPHLCEKAVWHCGSWKISWRMTAFCASTTAFWSI